MGTRATARIAPTFIAISAEVVCGASRSLPCGYAAPYVPYFRPPSFGVDPARGPKFRVAVPGSRFTLFALADRCPISPSLYPPQAALRFDSPYGGAHKRGSQRGNIAIPLWRPFFHGRHDFFPTRERNGVAVPLAYDIFPVKFRFVEMFTSQLVSMMK
jgi:hypothetical protein